MNIVKVIAGLACMVIVLFLGAMAWISLRYGFLWFSFLLVVFALGLVASSLFLILNLRSPLSKNAKILLATFATVFSVGWIVLDSYVRFERHALQIRAKEFLSRPVPDMFKTDTIGVYQAAPNATVLSISRGLIERYANNGRIRWSAAITGQFAGQPFETASCEEAAKTNEAARLYVVECKAIIDKEWNMGFWQWVEDTIEMKLTIPEIEEENRVDRFIQRIDGTWTNDSGMITISPNGTFSAVWSSQTHTNILKGTQMFRVRDKVLVVYPNGQAGTPISEEKEFRIIHVDDHNLIYEVDSQTNSMRR
jgi:hypothetical protein